MDDDLNDLGYSNACRGYFMCQRASCTALSLSHLQYVTLLNKVPQLTNYAIS